MREVRDRRGKRIREHDRVMEILSGVCAEYLSVEVKVRRLWSQKGRKDVRLKQRKELCDELPW